MAVVLASIALGGLAVPASAVAGGSEPAASQVDPATDCAEYAARNSGSGADWACFAGTVTVFAKSDAAVLPVAKTIALTKPAAARCAAGVTPLVVASDYISNVTEPIIASISGVGYTVPVTVRTVIYNHSADVKMSYTASPAVSVIWSLRIRRDNNLATDDTVFTYPEAYGSSYATSSYSFLEDAYSEGYNQLPYDGKKYFYDLYAIRMSASGKVLNILGSVQSDRMTCYKTVSCKFK
ncbi:hypothetical protein [Cellulomonas chitinilytica]|uniref:hypothetical protein n=1 Tax=Cellulomonas chitinilytica TaxID=398759 RepID=UPI0019443430|nr:hypothetical protein [Cellulomonas chitinilytica]